MSRIAPRRPNDDYHSSIQQTGRYDAGLTIVVTVVRRVEGWACKNRRGVDEVEIALGQRPRPFGRIKRDPHSINVATEKADVNHCWRVSR